jgi:beta-xylosidase
VRSDDFAADRLQPVWQWNHVPVDDRWSLRERLGFLRLHALPASDLWHARNTLGQRAIGPRSRVTVTVDASGLNPGDVAGLALFNRPYA